MGGINFYCDLENGNAAEVRKLLEAGSPITPADVSTAEFCGQVAVVKTLIEFIKKWPIDDQIKIYSHRPSYMNTNPLAYIGKLFGDKKALPDKAEQREAKALLRAAYEEAVNQKNAPKSPPPEAGPAKDSGPSTPPNPDEPQKIWGSFHNKNQNEPPNKNSGGRTA